MKQRQIQELLDSDDEYPDSYNEKPEIPAYQRDKRFDPIVFKWIENQMSISKNKEVSNSFKNGYFKNGYLSQKDLYCLKSVAKVASDDTFLWFVDFLVHKDIQSRYGNNLKSCLIVKFPEKQDLPVSKVIDGDTCNIKKYKIVVKV